MAISSVFQKRYRKFCGLSEGFGGFEWGYIGLKGSQGSSEVFQGVPENLQWVSGALKVSPGYSRGFLSALHEVQGDFREC